MKRKNIFNFILLFLLAGTTSFYAQNETNSSEQIKNLIAKKREFNKQYSYGYRIQIFYGKETRAKSIHNRFKVNYPNIYSKLNYDQPYWKVQVGNYKTKLEADRAIARFSDKFSGLIIIPLGK
ncbi:SPOR domain-containing protein [uncultured Polaribacter sp.]|uniref:SPOR domain-containing protein n=1 Tax=uncultured Polaribacter sp. TaxID=174711 RepID=UPI00261A73F8|nr:SPOR domain-containing protein [uncultured Polaribacter sp.]